MNTAEKEDLIQGACYGLISTLAIGWWGLAIAHLTATLWYLGGRGWLGTNTWRRIGCPLVLCLSFMTHGFSWWIVASFFVQWGALSIGYGIPDVNDPEGSWLGRMFGKYTRLVWCGLVLLAMIPLFIK